MKTRMTKLISLLLCLCFCLALLPACRRAAEKSIEKCKKRRTRLDFCLSFHYNKCNKSTKEDKTNAS